MRRLDVIFSLLLGLTLLAAHPASAAAAASLENRISGSAADLTSRVSSESRLSEEAVRENIALGYDLASDDAVAARGATSAVNAVKLEKQLASAAQMGEVGTTMAGAGGRAVFRDAQRVAQQYGGNAADWVKKTSSSFLSRDGTRFETHWVENIVTGERVEMKTIIQ